MWAVERESEILKGTYRCAGSRTVADLFDEYGRRVSEKKLGAHWELTRFKAFKKKLPRPCGQTAYGSLVTRLGRMARRPACRRGHDAAGRSGSVIREVNLFSAAFHTAVREWKWLSASPLTDVKRPKDPLPRPRVYRQDEIDRLILCTGYEFGQTPTTKTARVACAFLFALETAMRAGEIVRMVWPEVDGERRVVHVTKTKTGIPRDVPLSQRALEILDQLKAAEVRIGRFCVRV